MPYQAVIEARKAAEAQAEASNLRAAIRLGLEMVREKKEREAAQAALKRGGNEPEEPKPDQGHA
jgi:uncharacterized protein with PIN domain